MIGATERTDELEGDKRQLEGWRVVVSAWALVLLILFLLAGVSAVACPRGNPHPHRHLAGAVIPQHEACSGPGIPSAFTIDGCKGVLVSEDRSAYW